MYYLQSRYYEATICRFINADGYVSTGQGILGNNMFAYCNNNPVMGYDPTGEYCVANKDGTDTNYLDDWLIEGAGSGGYGGTGNYFGYGTSYYSYTIRSSGSATHNPRYYNVTGAVSVTDGVATNGFKSSTYDLKPTTNKSVIESQRFTADQDAVIQLAKEYKKTGISLSDANTLWQWTGEYGLGGSRYHGPKYDSYLNGTQLHIKINGMHINIYQ